MDIREMAIIPFSTKRVFPANGIHAQLLRYGVAGGIAALVDIGSFYVFAAYLQVYYLVAVFLSFSLGTFTNFLICNACIFDRGTLPLGRALIRHYMSSLGGLATNMAVMFSLIGLFFFRDILAAKIIATILAFFVNFTLIKFYAFNSKVSLRNKIQGKK